MGSITKHFDSEKDLTVYTVAGTVPAAVYATNIHEFYVVGPVTKHVLWDLTGAELEHLLPGDVQSIAKTPRKFLEDRAGGRTAIVAPNDLAFGLARMYEFTVDPAEVPVEVQVFRSAEEASRWLQEV